MKWFFSVISVLFHPILMPVLGVVIYLQLAPIYYPFELKSAVLVSIAILTILIPIVIAFGLKRIGYLSGIDIPMVRQRITPLVINILITGSIIYKLLPKIQSEELYFFFIGIMGSSIACLVMAIAGVKASIHMTGIGGVIMFITGLSFHFAINVNMYLMALILIAGFVASARLYLKAHNSTEILLGIIIGLIPQLITFKYWL